MSKESNGIQNIEAEILPKPVLTIIERAKNANEKIAPVTAVIGMFLIIEGWARKDWNQITFGLGLAVLGYFGLGDGKTENSVNPNYNTPEIEIYNNQNSSS
mgnify:CR=1 FL=1